MEDLYGDLPPPGDKSSNIPQIGNSWSSIHKTAAAGNQKLQSHQPAVTNTETNVKNQKPPTNSKFVPSTLLFKPRQTAVSAISVPSSSSVNIVQKLSNIGQTNDVSLSTIQTSTTPHQRDDRNQGNPSGEDSSEFNSNSVFEVEQPYDPRRPNDYSQYCAQRDEEKRLADLVMDNKRKLEELEQIRATMEQKRKLAVEKGDYQTLLSSTIVDSSGMGRGRGRGMANLPSWIVEQMKRDEAKSVDQSDEHQPSSVEQFKDFESNDQKSLPSNVHKGSQRSEYIDQNKQVSHFSKPSTVVLLKNMVSPKEVDEALAPETKMECQKYGQVISCEVYIVDRDRFPNISESEQVRVFVQFDRQESAIKAFK